MDRTNSNFSANGAPAFALVGSDEFREFNDLNTRQSSSSAITKKKVNIGGSDDPFYRYTMPCLVIKIMKGKTILVNIHDIAVALRTNEEYIMQSISYDIGRGVKDNSINGALDVATINEKINSFIDQWVLCFSCRLPEIEINVVGKDIFMTCRACGHTHKCDNKKKLHKFILKNLPIKYPAFVQQDDFFNF